eukprot:3697522-Amphidinium_carterae.1
MEAIVGVMDGRRLRSCIREMIRHGAQRILQRLEQARLNELLRISKRAMQGNALSQKRLEIGP